MKLNNKAMIPALSIAAALAVVIFVYFPMIKTLAGKMAEYTAYAEKLKQAKTGIGLMRQTKGHRRLIEETEVPAVIDAISTSGKRFGVGLKSLDQIGTRQGPSSRIVSIKMELEAKYEALGKFIEELGNLGDYIVTIESFKIKKPEKSSSMLNSSIEIGIHTGPSGNDPSVGLRIHPRARRRSAMTAWPRSPFLPVRTEASEAALEGGDIELTGIMWDERLPCAIINGRVVKRGDKVMGCEVVEIKKESIILNEGTRLIELNIVPLKRE